jgi:hypothetical protein
MDYPVIRKAPYANQQTILRLAQGLPFKCLYFGFQKMTAGYERSPAYARLTCKGPRPQRHGSWSARVSVGQLTRALCGATIRLKSISHR